MIDPEYEFYASLGVPLRTIYHWRKSRRPNRFARLLWQWFEDGRPSTGGEDWYGWRFWRNELWSPSGYSFTPDDLRSFGFLRDQGITPDLIRAFFHWKSSLADGTCAAVPSLTDAGQVQRVDLAAQIGSAATGTTGAAARRSARLTDDAISN